MPQPPGDTNDLLVCADVLGAFGVTAADIRRAGGHRNSDRKGSGDQRRQHRDTHAGDQDRDLEDALADVLSTGRDRRAVLRRTIARSDRGISCSARYARETLEDELHAVFESIGWSFELERFDTPAPEDRRQLKLRASDFHNRQRETTFEYPDTPLGTDNLPAVLRAINDVLLSGTDARFVLLSDGVDRWQAAMIDATELERLRDQYGHRVGVGDRPLLPAHGLGAYVPEDPFAEPEPGPKPTADDPWPAWAHSRESVEASASGSEPLIEEAESGAEQGVAVDDEPLIEEAESEFESASESTSGPTSESTSESATESASTAEPEPTAAEPSPSSTSAETDGLEFHGSPSVSRVAETDTDADTEAETNAGAETNGEADPNGISDANTAADRREHETDSSDVFDTDTLSGQSTTTRVSNDSFGSGVEWESDDDRYRALGAALGAGGRITVEGLLEDDDFLPELPAAEPEETRIAFQDPFDPAALQEAKAAAEESGFVWVDSGSLETTRISNG